MTTTTESAVQGLAQRTAKTRGPAQERYAELLAGEAIDVNELDLLAAALGKSPTDVEQDLAAMADDRRLRDEIDRQQQFLVVSPEELARSIQAHMDETQRIIAERKRELYELKIRESNLAGSRTVVASATESRAALRASFPDAFAQQ